MKIKSTYLGVEFDIPLKEVESAGEVVTIISHKVLKDLVYNSPEAKALNLQCRHTPIVLEPKHYVFLCAMSDNSGRRVEAIGESQESTTLTEIAQDYPATMAFNRAFDAAVIDFFGFPRKVYSDLQIDTEYKVPSTGPVEKPAGQPKAPNLTAGNKETSKPSAKAVKEEKSQEAPAAKGKANENDTPFPAAETKTAQATAKAAKETKEPVKEKAEKAAAVETVIEETVAVEEPKDEFDKTIIVVGSMKRAGLSVRECYKRKPDAVRWIAYTLTGKAEIYQSQKDVCRRFLESIGDTEGEMNNAS